MLEFSKELVRTEGAWRSLGAPGLSANAVAIGVSAIGRVGLYPMLRDSLGHFPLFAILDLGFGDG